MGMRRRLARAIHKSGTRDPESLSAYLIKKGWNDDNRPRVIKEQKVTVVPALSPAFSQAPMAQLPDFKSMPVDHRKTNYLQ